MDKIKQNKIIFTMVGSILVSVIVFLLFTLMPLWAAKEGLSDVTLEKEREYRGNVSKTPKNKVISDLKLMHEQIRKSRIKILQVLHQADKALEMQFSGVDFGNITSFTGKMNIYVAALKDYYGSFKNVPPDIKSTGFATGIQIPDEPFDPVKENLNDEGKCRLAQKKLMITIELLNALNATITELKQMSEQAPDGSILSRFKNSSHNNGQITAPRCAITELKFYFTSETVSKPRDERTNAGIDGAEFYATLPFSLEVILEPEAASLFLRNLASPKNFEITISEFPEIDDNMIEAFKEKLIKDKIKEQFHKKLIEDYRLELELKRNADEFKQVKRIFAMDKTDFELEAASTAVRRSYGMRFDMLSATVNGSEIQQSISKHLFRDADAKQSYMDSFPDDIGLDKKNPLPPQGAELKDHEGRYKKTNKVREDLSRLLVPENEKGPAYFIVKISGAAVDFNLKSLIEQIIVEEGLITGGLNVETSSK